MGAVLVELYQVLSSKQSKALKDYAVGAIFGAGISWIATPKLSYFGRIGIAAGASAFVGYWRLGSSLDSCVDHILSLEGTKMQKELANILVTKYRDDPWRMRHISKHFYSEQVFDDTTSDQPKIRWRYRNFFSDHVDHGQRTNESNSYGDSQGDYGSGSHSDYNSSTNKGSSGTRRPDARMDSEGRKYSSETKQVPMKPVIDAMDPLDCFFGHSAMEEIHPPNPSTTSTRTHSRSHKRAHRRRRMRHQDVVLNPQHL